MRRVRELPRFDGPEEMGESSSPEQSNPPPPPQPPEPTPQKVTCQKPSYYLTVCAIARDELDLLEWIAYQFAIGVEHIHLFDNESIIPIAERIPKWIEAGKVSVERVRGRRVQTQCYTRHLRRAQSQWTAYIDVDEFMLPHHTDDLKTVLAGFEKFGALIIPWITFGSNGHQARPESVLEAYTMRGPKRFSLYGSLPQHKSIVQNRFAWKCPNPHYFRYLSGHYSVDTNRKRHWGWHSTSRPEVVQLNHYMTKSGEDWLLKQERLGGFTAKPRSQFTWGAVESKCNQIEDLGILRFMPAVKALMEEFR
jgi:hypothetical protein